MPGAGGFRVANYLASAAPRDGLAIGMHTRGIIQAPILGDPAARFDSADFSVDRHGIFVRERRLPADCKQEERHSVYRGYETDWSARDARQRGRHYNECRLRAFVAAAL